jgi:hypothetical protein
MLAVVTDELLLQKKKKSRNSLEYTQPLFYAPWQFTLLNLRSLTFGLTPFGWLRSIHINPLRLTGISFYIHAFFIYAHFSKSQLGQKQGLGVLWITYPEYLYGVHSRQIIAHICRTNICADWVYQPLLRTVTDAGNFRLMSHCTSPTFSTGTYVLWWSSSKIWDYVTLHATAGGGVEGDAKFNTSTDTPRNSGPS